MTTLKNALTKKFEQMQLTPSQLLELSTHPVNSRWFENVNMKHLTGIAAGIVFLIGISTTLFFKQTPNNLPQLIAEEVVVNHFTRRPVEIQSDSIAQMQRYFADLKFILQEETSLTSNYVLEGGRYCSLRGVKAAQLRYINNENNHQTLYQLPYDEDVFSGIPDLEKGEQPLEVYARGMKVTMWREMGLLFVLTHE